MRKKKRFLGSISGGRSSVMMMKLIIDTRKLTPFEVWLGGFYLYTKYINNDEEWIFCFANTSREKKATLQFMKDVELYWGIKVTWVEAVVDHRKNKGTKHRVVSFETAKQDGSIYEEVIRKYGIPNEPFPHCTREMKQVTIRSFIRYIGWGTWEDYKTVIGYRADEPKRNGDVKAEKLNQWYPLKEWGIKKPDVAYYWNRQPFDLGIKVDADGNCELCWKKGDIKLIYQAKESPNGVAWIREMERKYAYHKAGRSGEGMPYRFFRDNRTIDDILEMYPELMELSVEEIIPMLNDKSLMEDGANFELYEQSDCAESCEPFTEYEGVV